MPPAEPATSPPVELRGPVLLVEDEESLRRALTRSLERAGYDVLAAEDGVDGLAKSHDHELGLVVTDVVMPRMGGREMIAALDERPSGRSVPVLFISGYSEGALPTEERAHTRVLAKPVSRGALLNAIRDLASGMEAPREEAVERTNESAP